MHWGNLQTIFKGIYARQLHTLPATTTAHFPTSNSLALIRSQPSHYIIASIVGRRHLLAPRDLLTIPRLKDARVGDRLILSEIHELGSRNYTLRGDPILPSSVVRVEATVLEHTKGMMERIVKFKRRKHYKKTVEHKQTYTRLRIGPFEIGSGQPFSSGHVQENTDLIAQNN